MCHCLAQYRKLPQRQELLGAEWDLDDLQEQDLDAVQSISVTGRKHRAKKMNAFVHGDRDVCITWWVTKATRSCWSDSPLEKCESGLV